MAKEVADELQKLKYYRSALVEALLRVFFSKVKAEELLVEFLKSSPDEVVRKFLCQQVENKPQEDKPKTSDDLKSKSLDDFYRKYGDILRM